MTDTWPHLIVPGWAGSGPEHWQTHWERALAAPRVQLADWLSPDPDAWTGALDAAVSSLARRDPRPPVLVAHSLGCIAIARWARTSRHAIRAALLVAPADVEHAPCLPTLRSFIPVPRSPLPFSSLVVTSDDDPCVSLPRAEAFATSWGSELAVIPSAGHLNAASNLGAWPAGRALLDALLRRTELHRAAS
jgi:predicted alpha/beta hydrolase family esterase